MAHQNTFNRSACKVLAADAHPIGASSRKIEKTIGVAIRQISGPVSPITNTFTICFRIIPVTLKRSAAAIDNFASGFLGVQKSTVSVKNCAWAFLVSSRIAHCDRCLCRNTERTSRHVGDPHYGCTSLCLAVAIGELAIKSLSKPQQINFRTLVTKTTTQGIVAIIVLFGSCQNIGQWLAHIIEISSTKFTDIRQELARREFTAQSNR